jgi:alkanesulfonate monooxygenase SsuD/methylene tetrahydromethanopterin reductase-like flavin-dependent oxidoreductase (luciferase family)
MWYGGGSLRSARWAGENCMNFLTSSVVKAEESADYARQRAPRTAAPLGPERLLFSPDFVGTSAQLAEQLNTQAAFREVTEVAFALPFTFTRDDYVQILTDMATRLGPALGWRPAGPAAAT